MKKPNDTKRPNSNSGSLGQFLRNREKYTRFATRGHKPTVIISKSQAKRVAKLKEGEESLPTAPDRLSGGDIPS